MPSIPKVGRLAKNLTGTDYPLVQGMDGGRDARDGARSEGKMGVVCLDAKMNVLRIEFCWRKVVHND